MTVPKPDVGKRELQACKNPLPESQSPDLHPPPTRKSEDDDKRQAIADELTAEAQRLGLDY